MAILRYGTMAGKLTLLREFWRSNSGRIGVFGLFLLAFPAIYAPFIANGRPLVVWADGSVTFPFLRAFFAPDSPEVFVDQLFNCVALLLPLLLIACRLLRRHAAWRWLVVALLTAAVIVPFVLSKPRMDKRDFRAIAATGQGRYIFAPIPFGPFEPAGAPYAPPDRSHPLGCDEVGRDVAARMIYGARTSLAVGILATALALVIGATVGIAAGYFRGWFDLGVMRLVEILMCFPTFLLLLILMSSLGDRDFGQSIPIVIAVLGLTAWIGIAFLVRGETLKQCALPYIQSCEVSGIPTWRIMFRHLLPNISPVLLTSGVFGIAGAILAENGLSFLGFGIQPPGASWGDLLRQAFANPLDYWHLTFFPGAAIFVAVISFNFIGEGIGKAITPK